MLRLEKSSKQGKFSDNNITAELSGLGRYRLHKIIVYTNDTTVCGKSRMKEGKRKFKCSEFRLEMFMGGLHRVDIGITIFARL